jgi:DNA polymerase I
MEVELHPSVILQSGTWNLLIAPEEMMIPALNTFFSTLGHFLILYVCGNYSRVLSRIHRSHTHLDIRRSFTAFQLLRILEEAHHSFIFLEYDATLFDEDDHLLENLPAAMRDSSQKATVLLYAPSQDRFLQELSRTADRVFYLGPVSPVQRTRAFSRPRDAPRGQTTLEVF